MLGRVAAGPMLKMGLLKNLRVMPIAEATQSLVTSGKFTYHTQYVDTIASNPSPSFTAGHCSQGVSTFLNM